MKVNMGIRELELGGKYLGHLREANSLMGDMGALRARLREDGYLLIRGLHDPQKVKAARRMLLHNLDANGQIDRGFPWTRPASRPTRAGRSWAAPRP